MRTRHVNWLLIAAILLISTAPLYAQRQQQNVAKLKADTRNLVGIIGSDKTKTKTYCHIANLAEQMWFAEYFIALASFVAVTANRPMTAEQVATLKRLAEDALKPNLTRAEADARPRKDWKS